MPSNLERSFAFALKAVGVEMIQQYRFHPTRRWRLDFADVDSLVAVEIDGGEFANGAHNRGVRMANDYEKRNAAIEMGFVVFQLTGGMVRKDPVGLARMVKRCIEARKKHANIVSDAIDGLAGGPYGEEVEDIIAGVLTSVLELIKEA